MSSDSKHRLTALLSLVAVLILALTAGGMPLAAQRASIEPQPSPAVPDAGFRSSPVMFIENAGQWENTMAQLSSTAGGFEAEEIGPDSPDIEIASVLASATQIAAGYWHTCALTSSGGVMCWGNNDAGQLGDGTTTYRSTPVVVSGLSSGVLAIAGGGSHTCAITTSGAIKCWGANQSGQLGDGTTTRRSTPVTVINLSTPIHALALGYYHTCALTISGDVRCWGANESGQLGNGTTTQSATPVSVPGLHGVVDLTAGGWHTCAVTSSGGVKCWGDNWDGQLGDGTTSDRSIPVNVNSLSSGVVALAAGWWHTCAATSNGEAKCWGDNAAGQLGDGTTMDRWTPVAVVGLSSGVRSLVARARHTCALVADSSGGHVTGGAKCWGQNTSGEIGDGTTTQRNEPMDVSNLSGGVQALSAGGHHTCALTATGGVKCWGANSSGELGDGTITERSTPVDVIGLSSGVNTIAAGGSLTCVLTTGGSVKCWGYASGDGTAIWRSIPVDVIGLSSDVHSIDVGNGHTCVAKQTGEVKCWGANWNGQIGDGTTSDRLAPVTVSALTSEIRVLACGGSHTCALTGGGGVKCWGNNTFGQLGDGTTTQRVMPVDVVGLNSGVIALAAGGLHTCAVTASGEVKCWGYNDSGQLGDGTTVTKYTPVSVVGLTSGILSVVAGNAHTCALTSAGGVKCWGNNQNGQLGDGTWTNRTTAVSVSGLSRNVRVLDAGLWHSCVVTASGEIKCWGANSRGQIGDGTWSARNTPSSVNGLSSYISLLAAGGWHTCAVTMTGGVKCWGWDGAGQLGIGTNVQSLVPVDVVGFGPPTYTISGRVTDASGTGIPSVTVAAGPSLNTTTDANGNYTFTGLPAGTYTIRPEKAPYAFSPALRTVTVPPNATGVDFQAVSITKIQVNQVLGNTTNYVAGKDTVIQVMMSDAVPYDPVNQQVVVKRNGVYITTLKPIKPAFPTQTLNFWGKMGDCGNWQQGYYTFEATVNGAMATVTDLMFRNRGSLTIRVVPVLTRAGAPTFDWGQMQRFIEGVYPLKTDGITWRLWGPLDARDLDLREDDERGKKTLENRLKALQPPGCDVAEGNECPRILGIIHYDPAVGKGWTRTARVAVVADVPEMQTVIAHEIGHDIGFTDRPFTGLGDVYDGGMFQCLINPAPKSYVGRDGRGGPTGKSCTDSTAVAWIPSATAPNASGATVLGTGDNQDWPYEVGGRGILGNKLSFMGHEESQDNFWVTPDVYQYLFDQLAEPTAQAAASVSATGRVAVVSGWIGRAGNTTLQPAYQVTAVDPEANSGVYSIDVLDTQGQLLASQGFDVSFMSLSDPPRDTNDASFRVAVRLPEGAQKLRVKHGVTVLTEKIISAHAPTLSLTSPTTGQAWAATGNYTIRWQGNDLDGDTLYYTVLYRQGAGDWIVLGGDLTTSELTVDAARLPGGTAAQVQVLATDGINTTVAESGLFTVGRKGPEAFITHPADGASFMPGVSFFLQGTAYDLEDGTLPDSAYRWTSNRDGDLGTGATNLVILSPGPHVITLTVTDLDGNRATATVRIWAGSEQFMPLILRGR